MKMLTLLQIEDMSLHLFKSLFISLEGVLLFSSYRSHLNLFTDIL